VEETLGDRQAFKGQIENFDAVVENGEFHRLKAEPAGEAGIQFAPIFCSPTSSEFQGRNARGGFLILARATSQLRAVGPAFS
jgi:hypothetical protein